MKSAHIMINWILVTSLALVGVVNAKQESEGERCISLMRIDSTQVLDGNHVIFRMKGGKNYLNVLPHRCPGLRRNQPFMYRTSLSVLCDVDMITVLDTGGFGLRPMASCGLGRFMPMLDADIDAIRDELKAD